MKRYDIERYDCKIRVFEFKPTEAQPVLIQKTNRDYIENYHNSWFEQNGYELVEVSNCSLFSYKDWNGKTSNASTVYGVTMTDSGNWINQPKKNHWLEMMIYQDGKLIIDQVTSKAQYPRAKFIFGGFACIKNGERSTNGWFGQSQPFQNTDRSVIGQRKDGTIVKYTTISDKRGEGLTAPECQKVCLELEMINALILDGGGSAQQYFTDNKKFTNRNKRKVANVLCTYAYKGWKFENEDDKVEKSNEVKENMYEIILDAGHGGKDHGATDNGLVEKDYVLRTTLYQYDRFKELGFNIGITRAKDVTIEPNDRIAMIKNKAKHCISNHINASGGDGFEIIKSKYNNSNEPELIAKELREEGQNQRRIFARTQKDGRDYYYLHRETGNVRTYIIEYGFVDSTLDDPRQLKENWKDYAEAVVEAFCKIYNKPYIKPKDEVQKVEPKQITDNTDIIKEKLEQIEQLTNQIKGLL